MTAFLFRPSHEHSKLQPVIQAQPAVSELPEGASTLCAVHPKSTLQLGRELFLDAWDGRQLQCLHGLLNAFDLRGRDTIVDLGGESPAVQLLVLC